MSEGPKRRRQPKILRRKILDAAMDSVLENGIDGLTLDAVAKSAGVSKGGLLHHFPNRESLQNSMFDDLLSDLEKTINNAMAEDPDTTARFSRAYLSAVCDPSIHDYDKRRGILFVLFAVQPALAEKWSNWLAEKLHEHEMTDGHAVARVLRLAADGLWASNMFDGPDSDPENRLMVTNFLTNLFRS